MPLPGMLKRTPMLIKKPQAGLLCIWMKVGLPGCNTTCRGRMAIAPAVSAAYQTGVQRDVPMSSEPCLGPAC